MTAPYENKDAKTWVNGIVFQTAPYLMIDFEYARVGNKWICIAFTLPSSKTIKLTSRVSQRERLSIRNTTRF